MLCLGNKKNPTIMEGGKKPMKEASEHFQPMSHRVVKDLGMNGESLNIPKMR